LRKHIHLLTYLLKQTVLQQYGHGWMRRHLSAEVTELRIWRYSVMHFLSLSSNWQMM